MFRAPLVPLLLAVVGFAHAQSYSLTRPDIHGDRVVFTAEGDLWLGDIKTKVAQRITTDEGLETNARFSPDGTQIAFNGRYDGGNDVYVMPAGGGVPVRLTFAPGQAVVQGWTPDGKSVVYRSKLANFAVFPAVASTVSATGGIPVALPMPSAEFSSIGPDGRIAFVPVSNEWANWYRYRAGAADDIWMFDPRANAFSRLTTDDGIDTTPVWANGQIYFVSERSGLANLWILEPASKRTLQVTKNQEFPVRYPASDGKRVIFQVGPGLAYCDTADRSVTPITFAMDSDRIHERPQRLPVSPDAAVLGPSAKRALILDRGQLLSVAAEAKEIRPVEATPGARVLAAAWSADGKRVAFVSDRSGENEIWIRDSNGSGTAVQLTKTLKANPLALEWSPDGKLLGLQDRSARTLLIDSSTGTTRFEDQADFIASYDSFSPGMAFSADSKLFAFVRNEPRYMTSVRLLDISTGKAVAVNRPVLTGAAPAFSPDGKWLAYVAERALAPQWSYFNGQAGFDNAMQLTLVPLTGDAVSPFLPKPYEEGVETPKKPDKPLTNAYDLGAISEREIELPGVPPGRYRKLAWVKGRIWLLAGGAPVMSGGGAGPLQAYDLEPKKLATVVSSALDFQFAAGGEKLLVQTDSGYGLLPADAGPGADPKELDLGGLTILTDPRAEWGQMLRETWRIARDFFYDPGMHGVDWPAMLPKYERQLSQVGDRSDLTQLQKNLLSELSIGHAYVGGPGQLSRPSRLAYLGADYAPAAVGVRFVKLCRGDAFSVSTRSPLLTPGIDVKEGDYLLAINGQEISPNRDVASYLVGLAGQVLTLTVNHRPSLEGARQVQVMPLGSETELRYQDWVRSREEYVRAKAGPDVGYVHIPDMGGTGYSAFAKRISANMFKSSGIVYDFRFNGGGNVSAAILESLRARPVFWWAARDSKLPWTREDWAPIGPVVAICNENNFSDGEYVIDMWKKLKLGPVVGKRTGGGEVGSGGGYALLDGGNVFIPNYGAYDDGHWIIEGVGSVPDFEVDQDPTAVRAGRDPQLDKAIELVKAMPPGRVPAKPPYPNKARRAG